jgi:uncharacterized membrane-anchored protein
MNRDSWVRIILVLTALAVLLLLNAIIVRKEALKHDGQVMLLELGSRDPRSLLQGDYMELFYRIDPGLRALIVSGPHEGKVVVRLDERQVARILRIHPHRATLADGELLLAYHHNRIQVRFGSDAYFFQEGQADVYSAARYGELRVDDHGESLLVGLRDANFKLLGPGN